MDGLLQLHPVLHVSLHEFSVLLNKSGSPHSTELNNIQWKSQIKVQLKSW